MHRSPIGLPSAGSPGRAGYAVEGKAGRTRRVRDGGDGVRRQVVHQDDLAAGQPADRRHDLGRGRAVPVLRIDIPDDLGESGRNASPQGIRKPVAIVRTADAGRSSAGAPVMAGVADEDPGTPSTGPPDRSPPTMLPQPATRTQRTVSAAAARMLMARYYTPWVYLVEVVSSGQLCGTFETSEPGDRLHTGRSASVASSAADCAQPGPGRLARMTGQPPRSRRVTSGSDAITRTIRTRWKNATWTAPTPCSMARLDSTFSAPGEVASTSPAGAMCISRSR